MSRTTSLRSFVSTLTLTFLAAHSAFAAATVESPATTRSTSLFSFIQHGPWWLHPVLTVSTGIATTRVGQSQTLTNNGDVSQYQYSRANQRSSELMWGGFVGTEIPLNQQWAVQVGLGYYQPQSFSSGN
jgi:hypothetical protein